MRVSFSFASAPTQGACGRNEQRPSTIPHLDRSRLTGRSRHKPGAGAGYPVIELSVSAGTPQLAYQGSTLVTTEHRGHRLGLRLKAATTLLLVEALTGVRSIRTWNAGDNPAMLAVNRELGFVVDADERTWQKRVLVR